MQHDLSSIKGDSLDESLSFWQETPSHPPFSSPLSSSTDVLVIGGGLLGAATCYWIARRGYSVTLVERIMPAYGATGRNGGFVSIGPDEAYSQAITRLGLSAAQAILNITLENRMLLRQVIEEESILCDYREPGHLHLALREEELHTFAQSSLLLQQDGVFTTVLKREQVQEFIHTPIGAQILGALFVPHVGLVHPVKLVQGLLVAAQRYGAQLVAAEALNLHPEKESVRLQTTLGAIHAQSVIVATNAWIAHLLPPLSKVITPVRGQVLAYQPMPSLFSTGVTVDLAGSEEYWQQAPDGTIILGGCRAAAEGYDIGVQVSQTTAVVQAALEQVFPQLFPHLPRLQVSQRWAGLMAFTPDFLPIADRVVDLPNTWVVGGFCGHGMPFGLRFGQLLAEAMTSNVSSSTLFPFQLNRTTLNSINTDLDPANL